MSIPVVFIHQGVGLPHLPLAIKQACRFGNQVVLLGDDHNKGIQECTKWESLAIYAGTADAFSKVYVHHQDITRYNFELFCICRWFILRDWLKSNNVQECFCFDSDVMFYANAIEEAKKFNGLDFTLGFGHWGNGYFSLRGLEAFCQFVHSTYVNKGYDYDRLVSHYELRKKHGLLGGVCDMTLFELYRNTINPAGVGELMHITADGSTYDHVISISDGYEMDSPLLKRIYIANNLPWCKQLSTGRMIRFNTLHFQGNSKLLMQTFFDALQPNSQPLGV